MKKNLTVWNLFSVVILAAFALFIMYPIFLILYRSVIHGDTGALTLQNFAHFFAKKFYWGTMVNSLKVTVVSTILSAALGLPLAYLMRSVKIKGSSFLNILIVISYLSPPFIGAYAWIQMLGRQGVITQFLNDTFGLHYGGVYGFAGIVLVFTLQSFPLVYIYVSGALKNLDNSLNEAAESLGCSRMGRIWKIIVPLVMPTLLASSMLVFMRVFADFGTPMLIGEGYKTLPVLIYNQFMGEVSGDDGFAAAICCIVIGLTIVMFFVQRFLAGRNTYAMTALKPMAAESLGGLRNILAHLAVYMTVGLAIPAAHRAGMISSRQMKRQFAGKMVLYILLTVGGGAADRLLASVGRPDLFMEMCVSYLAASEMLSIVENLNDAGVGVLSGLVRKLKRK